MKPPRPRASAYGRRLEFLLGQFSELGSNDELVSHWARYIAVLLSGYLEVSIREIISIYVEQRSHPSIASYVARDVRQALQNPNMARIEEVLSKFDPEIGGGLRKGLSDNVIADIDSLVSTRMSVSHGGDSGVTPGTTRRWFESCNKVIDRAVELLLR